MSDPKDMLVCADMAALVNALGATRKVLERGVTALERIAAALETEREWFEHAPANDAVDAVILAALSAIGPQSVERLSERISASFAPDGVFDGNIPVLRARLLALEVAGKVESPDGHGWVLTEAAR